MAIYITGDTHGYLDINKLSNEKFKEGKALTRQDYVIICGDFGLPFLPSDVMTMDTFLPNQYDRSSRKSYRHWIKWLSERKYTVLWLDGNHDNHDFWRKQKVTEWNGGRVQIHPDADNVIHLMRGEYYTIDGTSFWVMGGAWSVDQVYRTEGISWWRTEEPSRQEMDHGLETLAAHHNKVDVILTHAMPHSAIAPVLGCNYRPTMTSSYLDQVYQNVDFGYWYCGHYHQDVDNRLYRIRVLYQEMVALMI